MFNKGDLKEWIQDYISNKGKRSLHIAINNSNQIKLMVKEETNFLPEDSKYNQRCYHILNDLYQIPKCKKCGIKEVNFNNRDKDWRYLDYCSSKCGRDNEESKSKYKETAIKKWGVDNFSKTEDFKNLMIKNNRDRYDVDWYQQSDDFREKSILTCLKKYGFDSFTKTDEFKNKIRKTFQERYGVDWYSKSQEFKKKFRETCLDRYGVEHFLQSDVIIKKFKIQFKHYKLPSGKIVNIQGYEDKALNKLLERHDEEDLCISNSEIRNEVGVINYLFDDFDRIYIPDIYVKSLNKIIEVKSKWTYDLEKEKNRLKKESCEKIGLNFEFWIINKKGDILVI